MHGRRTTVTGSTILAALLFPAAASAVAGVRRVELSLCRVSLTRSRAKPGRATKIVTARRARARAATPTRCSFLDPKAKKFVGRPCTKPIFFTVAIKDGRFAFRLRKDIAYRLGSYVLSARATDVDGVTSAPATSAFRLR